MAPRPLTSQLYPKEEFLVLDFLGVSLAQSNYDRKEWVLIDGRGNDKYLCLRPKAGGWTVTFDRGRG